jgi:hypothetical protein
MAYENVQAAGVVSRQQQKQQVQQGGQRLVVGADATYLKVKGETVGLEVVVDDQAGELLGLDIITSEKSEEILALIQKTLGKVDGGAMIMGPIPRWWIRWAWIISSVAVM